MININLFIYNLKNMRAIRTNNNTSHNTERSLNSSTAFSTTTVKQKYPKCEVKKQHNKDLLNLVCLTSTCKNKGLICSVCKSQSHSKHNVVPVKTFLNQVKNSYKVKKQETMMEPNEEVKAQKSSFPDIGKIKNQMLTILNFHIQTLAEEVQKMEQKIIKQSEELENILSQQQNTKQNLQTVVEDLLENIPEETKIYRRQISMIVDILKIKSDNSFEFECSFNEKINNFRKKNDSFKMNMENWISSSFKELSNIFNETATTQRPETALNAVNPKFSQLKGKGISLSGDNKIAKQTNYNLGKLVLLNMANIKQKSITFKISTMTTNICVGVGLKDVIKNNTYKWNQAALGHGTFLLAKNSYVYSHNDKNQNMNMKGFPFANGDEINVTVKGGQVVFKKKNDTKASCTISLKNLNEDNWKQLVFCVCLNGNGDKAELTDNF